jgi:hypothetical protein
LSTDKKKFETKKPHARKLFAPFSSLFSRLRSPVLYLLNLSLWIVGIAAYVWLCWWLIGLLNSLAS